MKSKVKGRGKALKAKTTARKTTKRKAACPVEAIARRQSLLLRALESVDALLETATETSDPDKDTLEFRKREIEDRLQENRAEAARHYPTSAAGAMFILGSIMRDVEYLADAPGNRWQLYRRIRRSVYVLKCWLRERHSVLPHACDGHYLPTNNSPHWQLAVAADRYILHGKPDGAAS